MSRAALQGGASGTRKKFADNAGLVAQWCAFTSPAIVNEHSLPRVSPVEVGTAAGEQSGHGAAREQDSDNAQREHDGVVLTLRGELNESVDGREQHEQVDDFGHEVTSFLLLFIVGLVLPALVSAVSAGCDGGWHGAMGLLLLFAASS